MWLVSLPGHDPKNVLKLRREGGRGFRCPVLREEASSRVTAALASGVARLARQHGRIDADLAHRALVLRLDVGDENQVWVGGSEASHSPGLVFQLARAQPA